MTHSDERPPDLGPPIDVRPLFAEQQAAFIELIGGLDADEWTRPTVCPGWSVKDVAAHVLGDHLARLSIHRDEFTGLRPRDGEPFPVFLDRINDEWVTAARRISSRSATRADVRGSPIRGISDPSSIRSCGRFRTRCGTFRRPRAPFFRSSSRALVAGLVSVRPGAGICDERSLVGPLPWSNSTLTLRGGCARVALRRMTPVRGL